MIELEMPRIPGKRFVVTGAAGFIGSHLAEELVRQGKEVVCIDNFRTGKRENLEPWWNPRLCTLAEVEVGNPDAMCFLFDGADAVFHQAASKCTVCNDDPLNDLLVNAWGSFAVFDFAAMAGVKTVVYASTGSVYGEGGSLYQRFMPESFYGVSKLAAEHYLRILAKRHRFHWAALRYHHVYGPRQDDSDNGGVVPIFIRKALADEPLEIFGDGHQIRWFCHVSDVVRANLGAVNCALNEGYDVVGPHAYRISELAGIVIDFTGSGSRVVHRASRVGDIRSFEFREFGKVEGMMPFPQGLRSTIEWYKERKARHALA